MNNKISWCLKQKNGIELVEPNGNLAHAYLKDADESLLIMLKISGKWKVVTAYYACYNALYSLLMQTGIKSEIHDCTLALMPLFGFTKQQILFVARLKDDRIAVQYYLEPAPDINDSQIKIFVSECKRLLLELEEEVIRKIRGQVKNG